MAIPVVLTNSRRAQTRSMKASSGSCQARMPLPLMSIVTCGVAPAAGIRSGAIGLRFSGKPKPDQ